MIRSDCPHHQSLSRFDQPRTVHRALADENRRHLAAGKTARERYPSAVKAADHAFALVRDGLAAYYGQSPVHDPDHVTRFMPPCNSVPVAPQRERGREGQQS